jgi:hypothetical protein
VNSALAFRSIPRRRGLLLERENLPHPGSFALGGRLWAMKAQSPYLPLLTEVILTVDGRPNRCLMLDRTAVIRLMVWHVRVESLLKKWEGSYNKIQSCQPI